MLEQSSLSDDLKQEICQTAWSALAKDQPQLAAEALKDYAQLTSTEIEIAEVWAAMLAWVDDLDHLEREARRLCRPLTTCVMTIQPRNIHARICRDDAIGFAWNKDPRSAGDGEDAERRQKDR